MSCWAMTPNPKTRNALVSLQTHLKVTGFHRQRMGYQVHGRGLDLHLRAWKIHIWSAYWIGCGIYFRLALQWSELSWKGRGFGCYLIKSSLEIWLKIDYQLYSHLKTQKRRVDLDILAVAALSQNDLLFEGNVGALLLDEVTHRKLKSLEWLSCLILRLR